MKLINSKSFLFMLVIVVSMIIFLQLRIQPGNAAEGDEVVTQAGDFSSGINICIPPITAVTLVSPTIVGSGTAISCNQTALQSALDAGGHIAFNCGLDPVTIALSSPLQISSADTVIDGGGMVTLDGLNNTKIMENPFTPGGNALTLQNLRFVNGRAPTSNNLAENSGAALTSGSPGTTLHIISSTFASNHTNDTTFEDNQGGAIFSSNSYETVIVGSVFEDNSAGNGGALGGIATGLLIFNSRFSNNSALDSTSGGIVRGYGGAIHLDGVTNGFNPDSNKTVNICGSTFEGNESVRGGGAIGVVVSDNNGTKATIEQSTFTDNEVTGLSGQYGQGGAIYHIEDEHAGANNEDNFEISQTTFSGNLAGRQGGAVWVYILGNGRIVNSTFDHNSTTAPFNTVGQGGAMAITLGKLDIINTTFSHNHAAYQAGAIHGGGTGDPNRIITLTNTIFYSNTLNYGQTVPSETEWQGYHTNRPFNNGGQNIQFPRYKPIYDNDHNNNITVAPIYEDPLLAALGNYGGPNQTIALQAGSPAINQGSNSNCPIIDQRGFGRTDGLCDIGAYESGAEAGPVLTKISPTVVGADNPMAFTLTATGAGFSAQSVVRWDGANRPTTFINQFELQADIMASDVDNDDIGTVNVTVYDPVNSGVESDPLTFTVLETLSKVYLPLVLKD